MSEMILTDEMKKVLDIVDNTEENIFVTGKAGAGKTTFLKYLIGHTKKKYVVAAPTGVAAINAGGVTLHTNYARSPCIVCLEYPLAQSHRMTS